MHSLLNSIPGTIDVTADIQIKLEQVGPTVISTDGKYSEDTTIRVTAVLASSGATLTGFTGVVEIAEAGTAIYTQNSDLGAVLPPSVQIESGGSASFVAKSLANPTIEGEMAIPPPNAVIRSTNYPLFGGAELQVPQWVVSATKIHDLAGEGVYDWVQARVRDIVSSASPAVAEVLSSISTYSISNDEYAGHTNLSRANKSPIFINPFFPGARIDSLELPMCGLSGLLKRFTSTVLHEARHAYQGRLSASQGNDPDEDWLVGVVPVAPTSVLLDSTASRLVCDQATNTTMMRSYRGNNVFDSMNSPDFVDYAMEMDAWAFTGVNR